LQCIVAAHRQHVPADDDLLGLYAAIERDLESGPYRSYREVLQQVVRDLGARLNFTPSSHEAGLLADSVKDWLPFPDTVAALRRLASRYQLVILSNVDDDLFAATARRLQTKFDDVITAQQARSYKPSHSNFRLALQRISVAPEQVLHVAQSLYHDIAPARQLGLANVWVNRRAGRKASASGSAVVTPDLEVPDLKTLADLMGV
jgi:2-haloacid dehalogenase